MKTKEEILIEFGCPNVPFDENVTMYYPAILSAMEEYAQQQQLNIHAVSSSLYFSEREVDFAYLCGVFNTSGIDGLHTEIQRLKELGKEPHELFLP